MELVAIKDMGVLGRIVIPHDLRDACDLKPGTLVNITIRDGAVVIKPVENAGRCALCGNEGSGQLINNRLICDKCRKEVKDD